MTKYRFRLRAAVMAVVIGAGLLAGTGGSGQAMAKVAAPAQFQCYVSIDDPRLTGHLTFRVTTQGRVVCSTTVQTIQMRVTLVHAGETSRYYQGYAVRELSGGVSRACAVGYHLAAVDGVVTLGPVQQRFNYSSNWVYIDTCN